MKTKTLLNPIFVRTLCESTGISYNRLCDSIHNKLFTQDGKPHWCVKKGEPNALFQFKFYCNIQNSKYYILLEIDVEQYFTKNYKIVNIDCDNHLYKPSQFNLQVSGIID